jgi:hypothetical protein
VTGGCCGAGIGVVGAVLIDRLQEDSDAVAACLFGVVERHIGASKHGDGGFAGSRKGETDAEGDGEGESGDG